MQEAAKPPAPSIPPEATRYLLGPAPESTQFDFLIGQWDVAATRYLADGGVLLRYPARWTAAHLNQGRMVMDDFQALALNGQAVSSYITLRTWSPATRRWEMAGLAAFQPAAPAEWHGECKHGEMHLDATGRGPDGQTIRTRIRFFDIGHDSFAWESHTSRDEAQTWVLTASLIASRAASWTTQPDSADARCSSDK